MANVVVVGGGIAGLVAARKLAQEHSVVVVEASKAFGGKTQTLLIDGFPLEAGPEGFAAEPDALVALCKELDLPLQALKAAPRYVRYKGKEYLLPDTLDLAAGSGLDALGQLPLSRGAKWKLSTERFSGASSAKEENLSDFIGRRLGLEVWEILQPWASAQWGGPASELSVQAAFKNLEELETQGGLVVASRKRSPLGRYTLQGGLASLTKAIGQGLLERGAALLHSSEALGITRGRKHWNVHLAAKTLEVDAVIVALPAPQAAKFFRPSAAEMATSLNHFPHNHAAKVWLALRTQEPAREVFPAFGEGFEAQAIQIFEPQEAIGIQWVRLAYAGERARAADVALTQLATEDIQTLLGKKEKPAAAWVFRHPRSRPQFVKGYAHWLTALERPLLQAPGIFLTGSYLAGPDLSQTVNHAQSTANHALDFLELSKPVS